MLNWPSFPKIFSLGQATIYRPKVEITETTPQNDILSTLTCSRDDAVVDIKSRLISEFFRDIPLKHLNIFYVRIVHILEFSLIFNKIGIPGLFPIYFKQTIQFYYNKLMWKMYIKYSVRGLEPTTSWTRVFSHNH